MRKLYKAKTEAVVYFQSDETDETKLSQLAEKYLLKELKANGLKRFPETKRVRGYEKLDGDWAKDDFLWGSETRDGAMTLGAAMQQEQMRADEREERKSKRAELPAPKGQRALPAPAATSKGGK